VSGRESPLRMSCERLCFPGSRNGRYACRRDPSPYPAQDTNSRGRGGPGLGVGALLLQDQDATQLGRASGRLERSPTHMGTYSTFAPTCRCTERAPHQAHPRREPRWASWTACAGCSPRRSSGSDAASWPPPPPLLLPRLLPTSQGRACPFLRLLSRPLLPRAIGVQAVSGGRVAVVEEVCILVSAPGVALRAPTAPPGASSPLGPSCPPAWALSALRISSMSSAAETRSHAMVCTHMSTRECAGGSLVGQNTTVAQCTNSLTTAIECEAFPSGSTIATPEVNPVLCR